MANTVAVLVEEAEGLLELGDLVVGELVRHGKQPERGSDGGREGSRQAERRTANGGRCLEVGEREREEKRGHCAVSGQRQVPDRPVSRGRGLHLPRARLVAP